MEEEGFKVNQTMVVRLSKTGELEGKVKHRCTRCGVEFILDTRET